MFANLYHTECFLHVLFDRQYIMKPKNYEYALEEIFLCHSVDEHDEVLSWKLNIRNRNNYFSTEKLFAEKL